MIKSRLDPHRSLDFVHSNAFLSRDFVLRKPSDSFDAPWTENKPDVFSAGNSSEFLKTKVHRPGRVARVEVPMLKEVFGFIFLSSEIAWIF